MVRHWRGIYLAKLRANQAQLQTIADRNPINYQPLYLLVEAERLRAQLAFDRSLSKAGKGNLAVNVGSGSEPQRPPAISPSSSSSRPVLRPASASSLHTPVPIGNSGGQSGAEQANVRVTDAYAAAISACSTIKSRHSSSSSAPQNPHLCILAMASELCSRFHLENGNHGPAVSHMMNSLQAYADWNADRKRQLLMREFPNLHRARVTHLQHAPHHGSGGRAGGEEGREVAVGSDGSAQGGGKKELLLVRNDAMFKFHHDDDSQDNSPSGEGDSSADGSRDRSSSAPDSDKGGGTSASSIQSSPSMQSAGHSTYSIAEEAVDVDSSVLASNQNVSQPQNRVSLAGGGAGSDFDLRTVIKATQAISSELQLDRLLSTLMRIVLTNSGGEKGLLLSKRAHVNGKRYAHLPKRSRKKKKRRDSGHSAQPAAATAAAAGRRKSPSAGSKDSKPAAPSSSNEENDDEDASPSAESDASAEEAEGSSDSEEDWVVEVESNIADFRQMQPQTSKSDFATVSFSSGNISADTDANIRQVSGNAPEQGKLGKRSPKVSGGGSASSPRPPADHHYPLSIVNYVINSKRSVILSDASLDRRFSSDPYISSRRIRSVLCTPLIHRNKLVSVLFLENNTSAATFTAERLVVCRLLVQQAAISIDNARLYHQLTRTNQTLEDKVATRTAELEEAMKIATEANKAKSSFLSANSPQHSVKHHSQQPRSDSPLACSLACFQSQYESRDQNADGQCCSCARDRELLTPFFSASSRSLLPALLRPLSSVQNGVLGGTSLLLESASNLNAEQKEILEIIKTSGEVMLTLINGQHHTALQCWAAHLLPAHTPVC